MKKWSRCYLVVGLVCAGLFNVMFSVVQVSAQEVSQNTSNAYGTKDYSVMQLSSFAFQGLYPWWDDINSDTDGYRYMWDLSSASFLFVAPVSLPSGITIDYIGLDYCDSNQVSGNNWTLTLVDQYGDHLNTTVGTITPPTDLSGCGYARNASPLNYQYDTNEGHHLVLFANQVGDTFGDGAMSFRGAEIWYRRKISPAPAVATFIDVPPSSPFFQHIEALAAAGITLGYDEGGGVRTFRPGEPISREAMAAFLARALGLHWPK